MVEDDFIIARLLADMLGKHGADVVGPVGRVSRALALLDREPIDAAVLDINLAGTMVFPLASELNRRSVPFLFATGYADRVTYPPDLQDTVEVQALLRGPATRFPRARPGPSPLGGQHGRDLGRSPATRRSSLTAIT